MQRRNNGTFHWTEKNSTQETNKTCLGFRYRTKKVQDQKVKDQKVQDQKEFLDMRIIDQNASW